MITAHHGGPHRVDKFSLDRVGTGEGAQSYGWGLYFAQEGAVAEEYREQLKRKEVRVRGSVLARQGDAVANAARSLLRFVGAGAKFDEARKRVAEELRATKAPWNVDAAREVESWAAGDVSEAVSGYLYEVRIAAEEAELLDWDKPFSEQGKKVQAALAGVRSAYFPESRERENWEPTGAEIYQAIARRPAAAGSSWAKQIETPSPREASLALASVGVPGVRYLDSGSRAAGVGTSNYVIFDDRLVEIMKCNGVEVGGEDVALLLEPPVKVRPSVSGPTP